MLLFSLHTETNETQMSSLISQKLKKKWGRLNSVLSVL